MRNGQNGNSSASERYSLIFGLINFLEFQPAGQERVLETGWTEQNFYRGPLHDSNSGRELLLRVNGDRVGITIDYVPRKDQPRFLMDMPMTAPDALSHLKRWGRAFQRGRDYVIPSD